MNSYVWHTAADIHNNEHQKQTVREQTETEKVSIKLKFVKEREPSLRNMEIDDDTLSKVNTDRAKEKRLIEFING